MKPVVSAGRVIFLTLIFTAISALGIWLTYLTIDSTRAGENSQSEARLHLDSRLPGIIVFAIGASGLVLMMIKIPVQRILSVEHPKGPSEGDAADSSADKMRPIVQLAEEIEYIPLFSWLVLLIFRRETAKRVLFELPGDLPGDLPDDLLDDLPDDT